MGLHEDIALHAQAVFAGGITLSLAGDGPGGYVIDQDGFLVLRLVPETKGRSLEEIQVDWKAAA